MSPIPARHFLKPASAICWLALAVLPSASAAAETPLFEKQVLPLLSTHCLTCHGGYRQKASLDLRTRDSTLKGGESGPAVQPGALERSLLWKKISADEMPKGASKLSVAEKKTLRDWIEAGAPAVDLQAKEPIGLSPKARPAIEVAADIDREIERWLKEAKLAPGPLADDAEFLRRVYLDIAGTIPSAEQARAFLDSKDPERRRKLIDELLASPDYGKNFGTVWHNLLVPFVDGKRVYDEPFRKWLADAFNRQRGWDKVVRDILTAEGESRAAPQVAFFAGRPEPNVAADAVGRLFLGVQLECAECHNSPLTTWRQQEDFWGLAAFFGRVKVTTNKKKGATVSEGGGTDLVKGVEGAAIRIHDAAARHVGEVVPARLLGGEAVPLKTPPFRPAFADWAVAPSNPYFAPAAVNRWWAHFLGRGLVNPIDDFRDGNPPSHPLLLRTLAHELTVSGYDLKHLVRCICNSKAYQRTSKGIEGTVAEERELFARMPLRMLTPEMLHDALAQALGTRGQLPSLLPTPGKKADGYQDFANFFNAREEPFNSAEYSHGVLQVLTLLNAKALNEYGSTPTPRPKGASARGPGTPQSTIEDLYLTVLSRRPTPAEAQKMAQYAAAQSEPRKGYADMFWALLNSSEFLFNH